MNFFLSQKLLLFLLLFSKLFFICIYNCILLAKKSSPFIQSYGSFIIESYTGPVDEDRPPEFSNKAVICHTRSSLSHGVRGRILKTRKTHKKKGGGSIRNKKEKKTPLKGEHKVEKKLL